MSRNPTMGRGGSGRAQPNTGNISVPINFTKNVRSPNHFRTLVCLTAPSDYGNKKNIFYLD